MSDIKALVCVQCPHEVRIDIRLPYLIYLHIICKKLIAVTLIAVTFTKNNSTESHTKNQNSPLSLTKTFFEYFHLCVDRFCEKKI